MLKEIKDIFAEVFDIEKHPFLGTFLAVAFASYWYAPIILFFSTKPISERIEYIIHRALDISTLTNQAIAISILFMLPVIGDLLKTEWAKSQSKYKTKKYEAEKKLEETISILKDAKYKSPNFARETERSILAEFNEVYDSAEFSSFLEQATNTKVKTFDLSGMSALIKLKRCINSGTQIHIVKEHGNIKKDIIECTNLIMDICNRSEDREGEDENGFPHYFRIKDNAEQLRNEVKRLEENVQKYREVVIQNINS